MDESSMRRIAGLLGCALGQKPKLLRGSERSALPFKAGMSATEIEVCFVPIAEVVSRLGGPAYCDWPMGHIVYRPQGRSTSGTQVERHRLAKRLQLLSRSSPRNRAEQRLLYPHTQTSTPSEMRRTSSG